MYEGTGCARPSLLSTFIIAALICAAPGFLVWQLFFPHDISYALTNRLSPELRGKLIWYHIYSAIPVVIVYLVTMFRAWEREVDGVVFSVKRLNHRLFFLLAFPFVAALRAPVIEHQAPFFTLLLATGAALLAGISVYHNSSKHWWDELMWREQSLRRFGFIAVIVMIAAYTLTLSHYGILNHRYLRIASFDLAVYDNLIWNTSNGYFLESSLVRGGTHMSAHFDPILVILAPFYLLWPKAETILRFQAFWLASSAIPLFFISNRILKSSLAGTIIAGAWLLNPALHGMNSYEFHSLVFVVPLILWAMFAIERENWVLYWLFVALILLTREDMSFLSAGIGLYLLVSERKYWAGLFTILIAVLYLGFIKFNIMNSPDIFMSDKADAYSYTAFFNKMIPSATGGVRDFAYTLVTNPLYTVKVALEQPKILFVLQLMLPVLFLPLVTGSRLLLLAYGLVFCLLSSRPAIHSIYYQYAATLVPFIFFLAPHGIKRLADSRFASVMHIDGKPLTMALVAAVFVSTALLSWKFGALIPNKAFRTGNWSSAHFEDDARLSKYNVRYEELAQVKELVPPSASVSATRFILSHFSNRKTIQIYPRGMTRVDYLVVYLNTLKEAELKRFQELRASPTYEEIAQVGQFVVLKRRGASD